MDPAPPITTARASETIPADSAGVSAPPPHFPAGLRVLLVDDDPTCLMIIDKMLRKCLYDVTTCSRAAEALAMLRERKGWFDLVLSDVYMPDMDGFKLLEHIGLEMDLPVIMMSADDHKDVVMKGVTHGAVDYLIKPVRMEPLKNIWQHVVRKKRFESKELEHSASAEENDRQKRAVEEGDYATSGSGGSGKNMKRKKEGKDEEDEEDAEEQEDPSQVKKPRVVWSADLHEKFVTAVNQLGIDKAVPKKILELMKVPGLTRENVASHLQKYRLYLRRLSVPQQQGRLDGPFTSLAQEATIHPGGTVDGFDLQALTVSGQLLPQSLTTLNSGPRRASNTSLSMPAFDQIGFLNSGHIANDSNKRSTPLQQMNNRGLRYFSGSSNSIESRQLGQSHQLVQPYRNMGMQVVEETPGFLNLPSQTTGSSLPGVTISEQLNRSLIMHMTQQGQQISLSQQHDNLPGQALSRGQILNDIGDHESGLLSTLGQQISPSHVSEKTANIGHTSLPGNLITASYSSVPHAMYSNVHNSCITESAASHYPLASSIGATPTTGNVEALSSTSSLNGVNDFLPSYEILSKLCQNRTQDWKLQSVNLSYQSGQHIGSDQNSIDFGSSLVAHQDSIATVKDGNSRNTCTVRKEILSVRTEIEHEKIECIAQRNSTILVENSLRLKSEGMPDIKYPDVFYDGNNISNELMNVDGEQQQEDMGQEDPEFFDGYSLDNMQV